MAAAFTIIATVPILILGAWVHQSSLDKELAAVHEKHLLLAGNITAALERFAKDAEATFNLYVIQSQEGRLSPTFRELARQIGFRDMRIVDLDGRLVRSFAVAGPEIPEIPIDLLREIESELAVAPSFSRVVNDGLGRPTIYLARRQGDDRIVLGALDTAYIVKLQKAIAFGRKGHAAIVDHKGYLIAHPKPDWTESHKNIAKVEPVRRMMNGETGVTPFYSPAMKQDMISGFTTVAGPGWGVMVPQPMAELEERARDVFYAVIAIGLLGLAIAAAISWMLAGLLIQPVQAVLEAARQLASGRLTARVAPQAKFVPEELAELAQGFNGMARTIQDDKSDLLRALDGARIADRAKSEFLASMSHELRTPLNAIIGFSEVIDRELYGPIGDTRYKDSAKDINESGCHLLTVINDILDLSKIEAGRLMIEDEPIDFASAIAAATSLVEARARETKIELSQDVASDLPPLRGSETKMKQVLINLLSNAIKFTPEGGKVTLSAWRTDDRGVGIKVTDNGIGMSEEEIAIALQPFRQVDGRLSRKYEGTGLGLPLAKGLVELHGGSLTVESTPGVGTSVLVSLGAQSSLAQAA